MHTHTRAHARMHTHTHTHTHTRTHLYSLYYSGMKLIKSAQWEERRFHSWLR